MDKNKLIKWIEQEISGAQYRGEFDKENTMRDLLLKINRGYFDAE